MAQPGGVFLAIAMALLVAVLLVNLAPFVAADQPDCTKEINELQPCLAYVEGQVSIPSSGCCKGLLSVHTNRPVCLCILMSSATGGSVNSSTAQLLPSICKVNTDPSRCPALLKGEGADAPAQSSSGSSSSSSSSSSTSPSGKAATETAKSGTISLLPSVAAAAFGGFAGLLLRLS